MCEYQSSLGDLAFHEADASQIERIKRACEWDKVRLGESAQYHVLQLWKIGETGLRNAISRHIEENRKIFQKSDLKRPGEYLENHLHANVSIFEGKDVYVEMILTKTVFIIVYAHEHTTQTRLPQ